METVLTFGSLILLGAISLAISGFVFYDIAKHPGYSPVSDWAEYQLKHHRDAEKTTRLDRKTLTDLMGEANPYLATATGAFWLLENAQKKGNWNEFAKQVAYISKMAKESPEHKQAVAIVATAIYLLEDNSR